jgi:hypothetical protein
MYRLSKAELKPSFPCVFASAPRTQLQNDEVQDDGAHGDDAE